MIGRVTLYVLCTLFIGCSGFTQSKLEAVVICLCDTYVETERDGVRVVEFDNCPKYPVPPALHIVFFYICVKLNDGPSRLLCELKLLMKRIFEQLQAAEVVRQFRKS